MQDTQRIVPADVHAAPTGRAGGAGAANPHRKRTNSAQASYPRAEWAVAPEFVDPWRGC